MGLLRTSGVPISSVDRHCFDRFDLDDLPRTGVNPGRDKGGAAVTSRSLVRSPSWPRLAGSVEGRPVTAANSRHANDQQAYEQRTNNTPTAGCANPPLASSSTCERHVSGPLLGAALQVVQPTLTPARNPDAIRDATTDSWGRTAHRHDPLWACARAGDHDAFCQLVDTFLERLIAQAQRLLRRTHEDPADIIQDALLSAWERRCTITSFPHLRRWLFLVVRRHAISRIRRRKRAGHGFVSLHRDTDDDSDLREGRTRQLRDPYAPTPSAGNLSRAQVTKSMLRAMQSCARSLSPNDLSAIELYYLHNFRIRDIAELLGISVTAVKMRLTRARARLRHSLNQSAEDAIEAIEEETLPARNTPRAWDEPRATSPGWATTVREWMTAYERSRPKCTPNTLRRPS